MSKSDKLGQVDHATINYKSFRRIFYIEAQELRNMTDKQVADYRLQLEDIKVRGKNVPRPVKNWNQCGLTGRVMEVLKKSAFTAPMPIQVICFTSHKSIPSRFLNVHGPRPCLSMESTTWT